MARSALSANSETLNTELVGLGVRSGGILRKALIERLQPHRLQAEIGENVDNSMNYSGLKDQ